MEIFALSVETTSCWGGITNKVYMGSYKVRNFFLKTITKSSQC